MATISAGNQTHLTSEAERKAKTRAASLSILAAAFLIALKAVTGLLTGSISVLASLLDSLMDIFASSVNFITVRAASQPADAEHTYGHGKAESLGGLFQALVISGSGFFLIYEAIQRLREPHKTTSEGIGVLTMLIAIAVSIALVRRLKRVARETDSPALGADAAHYEVDIYINGGVLIALVITAVTGWRWADPLISIIIALYILWSAFKVGRESINVLMDRRLPADTAETVALVVSRFRDQGVFGFHDLRTRRSGSHKFVDMHLEIERTKSLEEAHELTVKVMREIEAELPRTRVQIHTDPVG